MASTQRASLNGGLGAELLVGSRGRAPSGDRRVSTPEAQSFLSIFIQKVAKEMKTCPVSDTDCFMWPRPALS